MNASNDLSAQSLTARNRIYLSAISCFRERSYGAVSMRDIAVAAGVSVGLSYRYFAGKDAIIMAWYDERVTVITQTMAALPAGQLADRYHQALLHALRELLPLRSAVQALFATAMQTDSRMPLMDSPQGQRLASAYGQLVLDSEDALRDAKASQLGTVLYAFHMLIVLFWLYDRSPEQRSTQKLLGLAHEFFKLLRPMFFLPMVPQGIAKLAEIVMPTSADSKGAAAQDDARYRQHEDFDIHRD